MKRIVLNLLIFAAAFCAVFFLARNFSEKQGSSGSRISGSATPQPVSAEASVMNPLTELLENPDDLEARAAALTSAEIRRCLDALHATGRLDQQAQVTGSRLQEAWANCDPAALVEWCRRNRYAFVSDGVAGKISSHLAVKDPARLKEMYRNLEEGFPRVPAMRGLDSLELPGGLEEKLAVWGSLGPLNRDYDDVWFQEAAKENPREALAAALKLSSPRDRMACVYRAVYGWSQTDPSATLAWLSENLPPGGDQSALMSTVLMRMTEKDPARAFAEISGLSPGPARVSALGSIMSSWARAEPEAVLDAIKAMPEGFERGVAVGHAGQILAKGDLQTATALLEMAPGRREQGNIIRYIASNQAKQDPIAALEWSHALTSNEQRETGAASAYGAWVSQDSAAAADHATAHWNSPGTVPGLRNAVNAMARNDLGETLERIDKFPPDSRAFAAAFLLDGEQITTLTEEHRQRLEGMRTKN